MALLFLPAVVAERPLTEAALTFTAASFSGNVASAEALEGFLSLPPDEQRRANLTLRAPGFTVNWTEAGRYHVLDPRDPSNSDFSVQKGAAIQGEKEHRSGTARATLEVATSNILLIGSGREGAMVEFGSHAATVQANPDQQWTSGSMSRTTANQPDPNGTFVQVRLPPGASQTELQQSWITITGNVTLYLWDTWLNVTDPDGNSSYHAGWETVASVTPGGAVRESLSRLLTVRAVDAEVSIALDEGRALLVSPRSSITALGGAHLESALGTVDGHMVLDEAIDIQGEFGLESMNATSGDSRMRGRLSYRADVTEVRAGEAQIAAPPSPASPRSPWWLAAAAIPILLVGTIVGSRRYGPVTLDDVEHDILSGHDRRARRSARRVVKKTPRDPDAVFLYATTLLQRKDFPPLLQKVEPLAAQIPKPERRGIAFVLAVAAHAIGDKKRSQKWGAEAARDPLLAQKLQESGVGTFTRGPSRFAQSGYA